MGREETGLTLVHSRLTPRNRCPVSDQNLRILHCLRAPVGGLFRHVCDLAAEQARRGHAVGVVCDAVAQDPLTEQRLAAL